MDFGGRLRVVVVVVGYGKLGGRITNFGGGLFWGINDGGTVCLWEDGEV